MKITLVQFNKQDQEAFAKTLKQRVNQYFVEKNISKKANASMVFKTLFMLSLLFVPYFILMFSGIQSLGLAYALWAIMGLGVSGIGMSVMHDANHGAYSNNVKINHLMGRLLDVIGGNANNWRIQHNFLHHTYTNIQGLDQDLNTGTVLRLTPAQKRKRFHPYQHLYAWFLYGLMTLPWMTIKDFKQMLEFETKELNKSNHRKFWQEYSLLIVGKIFYYSYMLLVPMLILPFTWWQILLGFVLMHYVTGFVLSTTFQLAHIMPEAKQSETFEPQMDISWEIHQMETTTNFAPNNVWVSWFIGGLNYQVEHHLFPNICHVHYKNIAGIVEHTAKEFGVPYNKIPNLRGALWAHGRALKSIGEAA
jgi:linoleoyl-CoA desaturase